MEEVLLSYGPLGAMVVMLSMYIYFMSKQNREDRKDALKERESLQMVLSHQHAEALERSKEHTAALNNNTAVLNSIKTLLESRDCPYLLNTRRK